MATEIPSSTTSLAGRSWMISGSRIWTIAAGTFTQLVRMKTFYFLLVIALLVALIGNLDLFRTPVEELKFIKKAVFGTMDIFAWLFAIVATAVLIPRDLEDRTLYTILSKPVLRVEYLIGKLAGVLAVILVSLVLLFSILIAVLHFRVEGFVSDLLEFQSATAAVSEEVQFKINRLQAEGPRSEMLVAISATFLKAAIVASVTMFLSTFASSSLFSIITSALLFMVGQAREMMVSFWQQETEGNVFVTLISKAFKLFIPDYQLFSFSEGLYLGEKIVPQLVWSMTGMSVFYIVFFLAISLLVFFDKEF